MFTGLYISNTCKSNSSDPSILDFQPKNQTQMPRNQNIQSALRDPYPCHVFHIFFTGEIHHPLNCVSPVSISTAKSPKFISKKRCFAGPRICFKGFNNAVPPPPPVLHCPRGRNWTPGRGVAAKMEVSVCFMTSQRANFPLSQASKASKAWVFTHFGALHWHARVPTDFPSLQFNNFNHWFTRHDRKWGSVIIFVE